jgi:hypothetical protein
MLTMIHGRKRSPHRVSVHHGKVKLDAGRKGAHPIPSTTEHGQWCSTLIRNYRGYLHLINKDSIERRIAQDLAEGFDTS